MTAQSLPSTVYEAIASISQVRQSLSAALHLSSETKRLTSLEHNLRQSLTRHEEHRKALLLAKDVHHRAQAFCSAFPINVRQRILRLYRAGDYREVRELWNQTLHGGPATPFASLSSVCRSEPLEQVPRLDQTWNTVDDLVTKIGMIIIEEDHVADKLGSRLLELERAIQELVMTADAHLHSSLQAI